MIALDKLQTVIEKYNSNAKAVDSGKYYSAGCFPDVLPQPVKDYVYCHFDVVSEDRHSIQFKIKD